MKTSILFICVIIAAAATQANSSPVKTRTRRFIPKEFQNINIEDYLKNDRAVAFQLKCVVYDGPCDRIGKYLKITIPEMLTNQCRDCEDDQKKLVGRMVGHIQEKFPKEWEDAIKKYQKGNIRPEDAEKLEELTGVKIDPKLVGPAKSASR